VDPSQSLDLYHEADSYPWERDPAETPASWGAFVTYRDMPKPRSLRRAAALHYHDDIDLEPTQGQFRQFKTWSYTYGWQGRIQAFDSYEDALKRQKAEEGIEEMVRRQTRQAALAVDALLMPIRAIIYKAGNMPIEETGLTDLELRELLYMARQGSRAAVPMMKMERLARGEPTDIQEGRYEHEHRAIHVALSSREGRRALADLSAVLVQHDSGDEGEALPGGSRGLPHGREVRDGEAYEETE
jgi:hypothetical protein